MLAHKVTITLERCHAREEIEQAFAPHDSARMVNTDQGSQFTATEFIEIVFPLACTFSMDGRGGWHGNVFVKRFWRGTGMPANRN